MKLKLKAVSELDKQYQLVRERLSGKTVTKLFCASMAVAEVKNVQITVGNLMFVAKKPGYNFSFNRLNIRSIDFDYSRYDVQIILDNGLLVGVRI